MDQIASDCAQYLAGQISKLPPTKRLLVGISGVPASGKSTLARLVIEKVNRLLRKPVEEKDVGILVGLDGWHLTRAQLDAMPNPRLAHDRRGAHWTFDGEAYVAFMRDLSTPLPAHNANDDTSSGPGVIRAPSFSHAIKDPTPFAIPIHLHHRLVVIEGLYTFLSIPPWVEAAELLDERWWVDIGEEEAKKRLIERHVQSGVAKDLEEAEWRARENDAQNGRFIKENMLEPTRIIRSIEDPVLAPK